MTFFDEPRGVWKCGQTLPECFINLLNQNQNYRERNQISKTTFSAMTECNDPWHLGQITVEFRELGMYMITKYCHYCKLQTVVSWQRNLFSSFPSSTTSPGLKKQRKLHADYQAIEKSYIKSFITWLCVFANLSPAILYGWRKASRALSHTFHISHNPFLEQIISRWAVRAADWVVGETIVTVFCSTTLVNKQHCGFHSK